MARRSTACQPMEGKRGLISVGGLPLYFVRSIISVSIASRVHARSISARVARICGLGAARASRRHSSARILQSSDLSITLLPKTGRAEQPRSGHRAGRWLRSRNRQRLCPRLSDYCLPAISRLFDARRISKSSARTKSPMSENTQFPGIGRAYPVFMPMQARRGSGWTQGEPWSEADTSDLKNELDHGRPKWRAEVPALAVSPTSRSPSILEGERDARTKRRYLSVFHFHVHFRHFGDAQVA
jgi:hypothetical protein